MRIRTSIDFLVLLIKNRSMILNGTWSDHVSVIFGRTGVFNFFYRVKSVLRLFPSLHISVFFDGS